MPVYKGINYNYLPYQNNSVVLFLHGFLGSSKDWSEISKGINKAYGILTVDLPGHGESLSENADDYQIKNCTDHIIRLLDNLNLQTVILVSYSMGGRLGYYLLTHFQKRFSLAVIESSTPGLKTATERQLRIKHDQALAFQLRKEDFLDWLNKWYSQPLFESLKNRPELFSNLINSRRQNDPRSLALSLEIMTVGRQKNLWSRLSEIEIPLLLITGELDSKYTEIIKQTADLCRNAQTVIIESSGHNVHLEQPERFTEELIEFLNKHC